MAVITAQGGGGSGFLGGLGGLMSLAGLLIPGAPAWMGAVGKGMSAIDGAMRGNYSGLIDVGGDIKKAGGFGPWINPAQVSGGGRPQAGGSGQPQAAPTVQPVPKISTQSASGMFNPNIYDSAARPNTRWSLQRHPAARDTWAPAQWSLPGPAQPVSIGLCPLPSATPGHPGQWW